MLQMHPTSCACCKSFNITNIRDFVIHAQVLWLACSINSAILHVWSPHTSTCMFCTDSLHASLVIPAICRNRAESRLCSCRPSWSYGVKTFHLQNYGDLGDLYTTSEKWWTTSWTWQSKRLQSFVILITYTQKYLDRNPSKALEKQFGPEHVSELSPQIFGTWMCFLDQSVLNVTIKPCPDQSKRLCVHVPPLVQPLNALRGRGFFWRHRFPLKCISSWFPFSHGKTRQSCTKLHVKRNKLFIIGVMRPFPCTSFAFSTSPKHHPASRIKANCPAFAKLLVK